MADCSTREKQKGRRCAAFGCGNTGLSLHHFPKCPKLRHQWIAFVKRSRRDWVGPSPYSALCSDHFAEDCFPIKYRVMEASGMKITRKNLLPNVVPTIEPHTRANTTQTSETEAPPHTKVKKRRKVAYIKRANTREIDHNKSVGGQAQEFVRRKEKLKKKSAQVQPKPKTKDKSLDEDSSDSNISVEPQEDSSFKCDESDSIMLDVEKRSPHKEKTYMVFESKLLELFSQCPSCTGPCLGQVTQVYGSTVRISQDCGACSFSRTWASQSQPVLKNTAAENT